MPTKMLMVAETGNSMRPLEADGLMQTAANNIGKKPNRVMKMWFITAMMATQITATHVQTIGWTLTIIITHARIGENQGQREQQKP